MTSKTKNIVASSLLLTAVSVTLGTMNIYADNLRCGIVIGKCPASTGPVEKEAQDMNDNTFTIYLKCVGSNERDLHSEIRDGHIYGTHEKGEQCLLAYTTDDKDEEYVATPEWDGECLPAKVLAVRQNCPKSDPSE